MSTPSLLFPPYLPLPAFRPSSLLQPPLARQRLRGSRGRRSGLVQLLVGAVFALSAAATSAAGSASPPPATAAAQVEATGGECPALLRHTMLRLQDEQPVPLCNFAGKVLLVVNTASFCGFTSQYKALEDLHTRYGPRGLVVLGFPSNDFGKQEPGDNSTIAEFCENTFAVRFPMFAKTVVRPSAASGTTGAAALNPLYADLVKQTGQAPGWNFHKYLVSRSGTQVSSYASAVDPLSPRMTAEIERLLRDR